MIDLNNQNRMKLLKLIDEHIYNECEDIKDVLKYASHMFSKDIQSFDELDTFELEEFIDKYCY